MYHKKQILESKEGKPEITAKNFVEHVRLQAKNYTLKTAFIFLEDGIHQKEKITYNQLEHRARATAATLLKKSQKGERCILLFPPGIDFIVSLMGCFFSGIIAVPAYPPKKNRSNERFWSVLDDSGATLILCSDDVKTELNKYFIRDKRLRNIQQITLESINTKESENWTAPHLNEDDVALLQYTSGSTALPRGVMVTHKNLLFNSELIKRSFNHDENLTGVNWLPPFHDMGLIGTLIQPLYVGGKNVIIPPGVFLRNPSLWLKAITNHKGTTVGGPNFALDYCSEKMHEDDKKEIDLSSVKVFFCGAEPIQKKSIEQFSSKFANCGFKPEMFYPCFGLAESTLMVAGGEQKDKPVYFSADSKAIERNNKIIQSDNIDEKRDYVGCGFPWAGSKVVIVDDKAKTVLNELYIGEIWTSGPSVCKGYWNNPEETKDIFKAYLSDTGEGPFLRTGDMGFIHEGQLFITGRLKDLIIIRGQNYYPQDIEESVEACHQAIQENAGAAFSAFIEGEERLVIVQEIKRTFIRNFDPDYVFEAIRKVISEDYEIEVFAIVLILTGSINKTTSGKIQHKFTKKEFLENKLKVIARWQQDLSEQQAYIASGITITSVEDVQQWLINWLSSKVKISPYKIDPKKPILSYGLDSIGAVELENEVRTHFGIELSASDFLENNKISELAEKGFALLKGGS